ncbi:MAG: type III-B CRISPR module RAMP protein Cmr1 [Gammaproteobacteria bacterium]|nr:type III-B CRISPR module RAMP protein Cmr1 [Gammaproteobacteria bacterium]
MVEPIEITATYQIVTPMFIGDAEQNAVEITAASVKGALRFWWRALHWGRVRKDCDSEEGALRRLHQREGELFGSAGEGDDKRNHGSRSGQAKFMLRISPRKLNSLTADDLDNHRKFSISRQHTGQAYLLGQGLCNYDRQSKAVKYRTSDRDRSALEPAQTFTVELLLKPNASRYKEELAEALLLLGLLGGLGSRARRGIGSIALTKLEGYPIPDSIETYKKHLGLILKDSGELTDIPPFTAFSRHSRIDVSYISSDAWDVLGGI